MDSFSRSRVAQLNCGLKYIPREWSSKKLVTGRFPLPVLKEGQHSATHYKAALTAAWPLTGTQIINRFLIVFVGLYEKRLEGI